MEQSRTPGKTPKSRKSSNKIYKITDNDVASTSVTSQWDFTVTKKTTAQHAQLPKNNIPQLSENASQTDGNGQKRTETDGRFALREDASWSELAEKLAIRPTCPFSSVFVRFRPF